MQTISKDSLDSVTGGTGSTIAGGSATAGASPAVSPGATGGGTTTGLGTCGGGLLGALNGLNNTIKGLNSNNDGFTTTDMLMFGMAMAFRNEAPAYPAYYVVGGYGGFGGGCGGGFRGGFHGRW